MARSRLLKPGFFKNEHLAQLSAHTRLCFAGLWLLADREGRLEDRPMRLKAEIFPYEQLDMDGLLSCLADNGFIVRYRIGADPFLSIPKFLTHQSPHVREADSTIPAPCSPDASTKLAPVEASPRSPVSVSVSVSVPVLVSDPVPVSKTGSIAVAVTGEPKNGSRAAAKPVAVNGQSKRPIFRGQRLTIFEWMLEDISQMLGPAYPDFGLDEFFDRLDKIIARQNIVLPKQQVWPWLQARVLAEAASRGLAIVVASDKPNKRDVRDAEALALMRSIQ